MDEAFCYTLIHDDSIDVPVCTSDVFLRRFVPDNDATLFQSASYNRTRLWATPAQQAALDALSAKLRLDGNDRLNTAYNTMRRIGTIGRKTSPEVREARRRFQTIQNDGKTMLARQFPDLKLSSPALRRDARQSAIAQLTREANQGKWKDLLDADAVLDKAERDSESQEIAESQVIRFVRLAKSVILAHRLRESNEAGLKARFARLIEAEARTPLPSAEALPREAAAPTPRRVAVRSHAASREDCGCDAQP